MQMSQYTLYSFIDVPCSPALPYLLFLSQLRPDLYSGRRNIKSFKQGAYFLNFRKILRSQNLSILYTTKEQKLYFNFMTGIKVFICRDVIKIELPQPRAGTSSRRMPDRNKFEVFSADATKFYLNISSSPSLHSNEKKWLKRLRSATRFNISGVGKQSVQINAFVILTYRTGLCFARFRSPIHFHLVTSRSIESLWKETGNRCSARK